MIGVFDSGVGGLSVLTEMRALLPDADLVYVADQARAPYGTKSLETVADRALEIARWLESEGADTIVIACNTASAAALEIVRAELPQVPIVGMEPAVKPAATITASGVIGVFATSATFQGRLFESVVNAHASDVEIVKVACPEWVGLVEDGIWEGREAHAAVVGPVAAAVDSGADALVLGCTHFSFLAPIIAATAGPGTSVVDPGPAVAAQTARVVRQGGGEGSTLVYTTDEITRLNTVLSLTGIIESSGTALPLSL